MTTRDEILKVALDYGWFEEPTPIRRVDALLLKRQPSPDAPLGGPRYLVDVQFRDETHNRVAECTFGVGRLDKRLTGGAEAIKKHLRWNGAKA